MKILWYRLLDSLQSLWNLKLKEIREKRRWGEQWRDMTRSGRRYSRVDHAADCDDGPLYVIRPEPGWEWTCQNCKSYSLITESMMPEIIAAWASEAKRMTDLAAAKGVTYKIPEKPEIDRTGCTNCRFRPGAPE